VPREALLRHEAKVFVTLQTGDDTFVRRQIELDRPMDAGWFVRGGLKAQDKVVVVGAQQLLSEELKGQGGGE
jgi:DNA-binding FadR family transcriptional regulator